LPKKEKCLAFVKHTGSKKAGCGIKKTGILIKEAEFFLKIPGSRY
jgi:hypothetical protein